MRKHLQHLSWWVCQLVSHTSDFYCVGVSGPLQSVRRRHSVICFLKSMTNSFHSTKQCFFSNPWESFLDPQHMFYTWCGVPETWPLINMIKTHHANSWSFLLHQLHCSFIHRKQREMEFSRTITQPLVAWFGLQWTTSRMAWVAKPNCGMDQWENMKL